MAIHDNPLRPDQLNVPIPPKEIPIQRPLLPPLALPPSPTSSIATFRNSPSVVATMANPSTPLSKVPPQTCLGLSPTKKAEKHASELIRGASAQELADKIGAIDKELASITPASKETLEKLKSAVTHAKAHAGGKEVQALASKVLQNIQDKLAHHSPKAAAAQAPAFHAAIRLKKQLKETTARRESPEGQQLAMRYNAIVAELKQKRPINAAELQQVGRAIQLQQTDTGSMNPVFIEKDNAFVFKMQAGTLERRAHMVCDLLGAPEVIAASREVDAVGRVQYHLPEQTTSRAKGIVQPLIDHAKPCFNFIAKKTFDHAVAAKLDPVDTQRKMAFQGLLGAWDLHTNNAFVQIKPNAAFEALEKTPFEYAVPGSQPASWQEVSLTELTHLKLAGSINGDTLVRKKGASDTAAIKAQPALSEALESPLQLMMFDNERVLGGQRDPHAGNPNHFEVWGGNACLPVRCFFLGCDIAFEPLQEETEKLLLELPQQKEKLLAVAGMGDPLLLQKLSKPLQEKLKQFFRSGAFSFTKKAAHGEPDESMVHQLPEEWREKITQELQGKWPTPKVPPFVFASQRQALVTKALDALKKDGSETFPALQKTITDLKNRREMILARMNRGNVRTKSAEYEKLTQDLRRVDKNITLQNEKIAQAKELLRSYIQAGAGASEKLKNELFQYTDQTAFRSLEQDPTTPVIKDFEEIIQRFGAICKGPLFEALSKNFIDEHVRKALDPTNVKKLNTQLAARKFLEKLLDQFPLSRNEKNEFSKLSQELYAKVASFDADLEQSPLMDCKKAFSKNFLSLFPTVDPKALEALTERMELSKTYIEACHEASATWENTRRGLPPFDATQPASIDAWQKALATAHKLLSELQHLPLDRLREYQAKAVQLAFAAEAASPNDQSQMEQFVQELGALLKPTTYGHFCAMYPFFNTVIDLLVQIEMDTCTRAGKAPLPESQIRKEILTEMRPIVLPHLSDQSQHIVSLDIESILYEAVQKRIITENSAEYIEISRAIDKCKPN